MQMLSIGKQTELKGCKIFSLCVRLCLRQIGRLKSKELWMGYESDFNLLKIWYFQWFILLRGDKSQKELMDRFQIHPLKFLDKSSRVQFQSILINFLKHSLLQNLFMVLLAYHRRSKNLFQLKLKALVKL